MHIGLVLESNTTEMAENVLHLGVGVTALVTTKVVEPGHGGKHVVDDSDDNNSTNRVTPGFG